jgi:hypothetical protein
VEIIDRLVGDEHRFEHDVQPSQWLGDLAYHSSDPDSARERSSKSMRAIIATAAEEGGSTQLTAIHVTRPGRDAE